MPTPRANRIGGVVLFLFGVLTWIAPDDWFTDEQRRVIAVFTVAAIAIGSALWLYEAIVAYQWHRRRWFGSAIALLFAVGLAVISRIAPDPTSPAPLRVRYWPPVISLPWELENQRASESVRGQALPIEEQDGPDTVVVGP